MFLSDPRKNFPLEIFRRSNNQDCVDAAISIAKKLKDEIYRSLEPALFKGNVFVFKHLTDGTVFDYAKGTALYDPNVQLNGCEGTLAIQVFSDDRLIMWNEADEALLRNDHNVVTYIFRDNQELFIAKGSEVPISIYPFGSRFATQYFELLEALNDYKVSIVYRSSCPLLKKAWFDTNFIFFAGGGKDLPETHLQESLHHFLKIRLRGIRLVLRELNVVDKSGRPVDIAIYWGEANRMALMEIKWLGKAKLPDGSLSKTKYDKGHVNKGLLQLKGYFDTAHSNMPTTIIEAFLVLIDGRRYNTNVGTMSVNSADGLHYEREELTVATNRQYFNDHPGFHKPIRMFAAPITD
jgi:hypothetical protein